MNGEERRDERREKREEERLVSDLGPADEGLVLSSEGLRDKQDKVGTDPRKEPARAQSTLLWSVILSWCEARAFPLGIVWSVCCHCSARKEQLRG